jgi:hypothetical protein
MDPTSVQPSMIPRRAHGHQEESSPSVRACYLLGQNPNRRLTSGTQPIPRGPRGCDRKMHSRESLAPCPAGERGVGAETLTARA